MRRHILPTTFRHIPSLVTGIVVSGLGIIGLILDLPYIRVITAVVLFVLLLHCVDMIGVIRRRQRAEALHARIESHAGDGRTPVSGKPGG